jgi:hypothetical protein
LHFEERLVLHQHHSPGQLDSNGISGANGQMDQGRGKDHLHKLIKARSVDSRQPDSSQC